MGSTKNNKTKLAAIKAIADDEVKKPHHIPINVYIQEAKNLYHWAREDKEALSAAGLAPGLIEDLPVRCDALSQAESMWYVEKNTSKEAARKWASQSLLAYDLRKRLLEGFAFAFRKQPNRLAEVRAIKKRSGHAGLIQALLDLYVMGKAAPGMLSAIGFDMSLLDRAGQASSELRDVLAEATTSRMECSSAKKIRDQAYTHLKGAVDEIRVYGRFVFRQDKERLKGYTSNHLRLQNARKAPKTNTAAAAPA